MIVATPVPCLAKHPWPIANRSTIEDPCITAASDAAFLPSRSIQSGRIATRRPPATSIRNAAFRCRKAVKLSRREAVAASRLEFVQKQSRCGPHRFGREQAGPGAGFKHNVTGADPGSQLGEQRQRRGGRELLPRTRLATPRGMVVRGSRFVASGVPPHIPAFRRRRGSGRRRRSPCSRSTSGASARMLATKSSQERVPA